MHANHAQSLGAVLVRDQALVSAAGATVVDGQDNIMKRWLWDPSRQNAGTAPRDPVEFRLNKFLRFKFVDRKTITVEYKADAVKMVRSAYTAGVCALADLHAVVMVCPPPSVCCAGV